MLGSEIDGSERMNPRNARRSRAGAVLVSAIVLVVAGAGARYALHLHRLARIRAAHQDATVTVAAPKQLATGVRDLGPDERYAYTSRAFAEFVADSYRANNAGAPSQFRKWFETTYGKSTVKYPGRERLGLVSLLRSEKRLLSKIGDRAKRADEEFAFACWTHKMVKKVIPKFSLDRGYEFVNVVRFGERQCFLQSVLIAGLLQQAGIKAGVAMVYRNISGEALNNGHAICLERLSNGLDSIIDASDPTPSVRHRGLFARTGDYAFVSPRFQGDSNFIAWYAPESLNGQGTGITTAEVRTLDRPFLMSQFWHYRGERAQGAIINRPETPQGLETARLAFEKSVALNPKNPLPTYFLGRVYLDQGRKADALSTLEKAAALYREFGWLPDGPKEYLAVAQR
jgi:tetratricopeptide (TPR) repeat protein